MPVIDFNHVCDPRSFEYHTYVDDWLQCYMQSFLSWVLYVCRWLISIMYMYVILFLLSIILIVMLVIEFNAICNLSCLEYFLYPGDWFQCYMQSFLSWVLYVCQWLTSILYVTVALLSITGMLVIDFNAICNPSSLEYCTYAGDCRPCCMPSFRLWVLYLCRWLISMLYVIYPVLSDIWTFAGDWLQCCT